MRTMRAGVVGILVISGLCGCSADDSAQSSDASIDDVADATIDQGCGSLADLCANRLCPSTLDIADDAGTWGNLTCTIYQSTNTCGGNDVSEAGTLIDAGDVLLDIAGTDTGLLLFYDSSSRQLVGAASFENEAQVQCWGAIPPTYCADITDGGACCNWYTGVLFGADGGVCNPLSAAPDAGDAGASDGAPDSG